MRYKYNKDYELALFFRPDNDEVISTIKKDLDYINQAENRNFAYGLFDPILTMEDYKNKIKNFIICIAYHNGVPIGFNYFVILAENFVHVGLIVINKNSGLDLMRAMTVVGQNVTLSNIGFKPLYSSTITSVPKAYEMFLNITSECYPSPKLSLQRPPAIYKDLIKILHVNYIKQYFPASAQINVNEKKFILQSIKREAGFKEEFHELPRAKKLLNNLFCQCWINYANDEDIIAIGKIKRSNMLICYLYQKYLELRKILVKIH